MKKNVWIVLFTFILLADLIAVYLGKDSWRYASKTLLMPLLVIYFVTAAKSIGEGLKKWIVLALVFSWGGDVLLLFESKNSLFFLSGLSSFLIAHIFYIFFFQGIRVRENISGRIWLLLPVVVYYVIFIAILSPLPASMKLPVQIYGVVISFMLMLALHTGFIKNKKAAGWMMTGAVLFILSDSLLALNKFYSSFPYAGIAVMLTYGMAQLCITGGAVKYICNSGKVA